MVALFSGAFVGRTSISVATFDKRTEKTDIFWRNVAFLNPDRRGPFFALCCEWSRGVISPDIENEASVMRRSIQTHPVFDEAICRRIYRFDQLSGTINLIFGDTCLNFLDNCLIGK